MVFRLANIHNFLLSKWHDEKFLWKTVDAKINTVQIGQLQHSVIWKIMVIYLNYMIFVKILIVNVKSKLLLLQDNFKWKEAQLKIN